MTPTHIWHGAVAVVLICVGVAIIASVGRLLYSPDFSFFGLKSGSSKTETTFSCPGMTFTASLSEDAAHVKFTDGREFDAKRDPPASEVPPEEEWKRYAVPEGTLVFWYAENRALIEDNGTVLFGECVAL